MKDKEFLMVDLAEVKTILTNHFFLTEIPGFVFLPSTLLEWAGQSKIKTSIEEISKWEDFEMGQIVFENEYFYELLFGDRIYSIKDEILLITDESIDSKCAFLFELGEFDKFSSFYEEKYAMGFFQPSDYIMYNKNQRILKAIHHEGKLITMKR
jgi:hypothetical protein